MSDFKDPNPESPTDPRPAARSSRMSIPEIARRLEIGRLAVYQMLEEAIMPGIRLGRRWIVTRHAYEQWERTCGMIPDRALLPTATRGKVLINAGS